MCLHSLVLALSKFFSPNFRVPIYVFFVIIFFSLGFIPIVSFESHFTFTIPFPFTFALTFSFPFPFTFTFMFIFSFTFTFPFWSPSFVSQFLSPSFGVPVCVPF